MPKIGPQRKNDQQVNDMVNEKSTPKNIFGYAPATSSAQTRREAKFKDTTGFTDGRKVDAPAMKGIGSKQVDSPTPFRTEQQGNLQAMVNNFNKPSVKNETKANRIATRAAKTRGKGEAALEAGNLNKSRRMAKRYDRQTSRLKKS